MGDTSEAAVEDLRAADRRVPGGGGGRPAEAARVHGRDAAHHVVPLGKVIDIAREAGTSPATFYQYFADVEAAILVLAQEMALDGQQLVRLVAEGPWRARPATKTALALTGAFFDFWDQHRPVLRVVDLSTDEGDRRYNIQVRLLNAVTTELAGVVAAFQAEGKNLGVRPMAQAGTLVTTLANVAAHHYGFEFWRIRTADVRISVARQVYKAGRPPRRPRDPAGRAGRGRHRRQRGIEQGLPRGWRPQAPAWPSGPGRTGRNAEACQHLKEFTPGSRSSPMPATSATRTRSRRPQRHPRRPGAGRQSNASPTPEWGNHPVPGDEPRR